jgi:SLT domain-containing protein
MPIDIKDVQYSEYTGGGDIDSWIADACKAAGLPHTDFWVRGYKTLCRRESSYRPNAINITDENARGDIVADGHPLSCSRGIAQCIPSTFAAYHVSDTSNSIYHPVANIAASMQYVRHRYDVSKNGSDLAEKVQQADPTRPRKGY